MENLSLTSLLDYFRHNSLASSSCSEVFEAKVDKLGMFIRISVYPKQRLVRHTGLNNLLSDDCDVEIIVTLPNNDVEVSNAWLSRFSPTTLYHLSDEGAIVNWKDCGIVEEVLSSITYFLEESRVI